MQFTLLVAIILGVLTAAAIAADPISQDTLDKHAKAIANVIPDTWEVRSDGGAIRIAFKQSVEIVVNVANPSPIVPPGGAPKFFDHPALVLEFVPALTLASLDELNKRNADRGMALQMLAAEMKDLPNNGIPLGDQGGYRATNPDQQARLDAYLAVFRALRYQDPPTLFAPDAAFRWNTTSTPVDPAIRAQIAALRARIEALFATKPAH